MTMKKRLQRLCAGALAAMLLLCAVPVSAKAAGRFTDVPAGYWAAEEIERAVELGLFQGETATRFGVGHQMTRGAFAVVLCRFFGWEMTRPEHGTYTDVQDTGAWYYSAVETAYAHGAITSQTETFRPGDPITREEMAVMLIRALGYGTIAGLVQELPMPFTDVRTNTGYLAMAYELGLVSGTDKTTFSPERTATREQTAVILIRLYDKLHQEEPERLGILSSNWDLTELAGCGIVAVTAGQLVFNGTVQVSRTMEQEAETAAVAAVRETGARVLLRVTGGSIALKGDAKRTALALASAAAEGGYDGVFLDIPKLKEPSQKKALTTMVKAMNQALGDRLLYVAVEAPAWQGTNYTGYDYQALGASADRLVVRVTAYEKMTGGFPTAPLEPLEEVYYALGELRDLVPAEKLSLMVTTTGTLWKSGKRAGSVRGEELDTMLADENTEVYYSNRYACSYLIREDGADRSVVWYLDRQALDQRIRMAGFFGVGQICFTDLSSVSDTLLG